MKLESYKKDPLISKLKVILLYSYHNVVILIRYNQRITIFVDSSARYDFGRIDIYWQKIS